MQQATRTGINSKNRILYYLARQNRGKNLVSSPRLYDTFKAESCGTDDMSDHLRFGCVQPGVLVPMIRIGSSVQMMNIKKECVVIRCVRLAVFIASDFQVIIGAVGPQ